MTSTFVAFGATLDRVFTGTTWAEGPVWLPELSSVRWSDIPNNRIMQFDSVSGETHVHRVDVEFTNGRTLDLDGHVVQCSHGRRAIEREIDGVPHVIVDSFGGRRLNSPNDIIVGSDASIWFTDPPYGIIMPAEGHPGEQEYGGCHVFRYVEATGELTSMVTDMKHPNGLAFSPDESVLYVSDTSSGVMDDGYHHIRAYDVVDGRCVGGRVFAEIESGLPDGFRVDEAGRVWTSTEDAVQVYGADGTLLESIPVPERIGNLCFGGDDGRDLYIAASTSLYRIRTTTRAATRPGAASPR